LNFILDPPFFEWNRVNPEKNQVFCGFIISYALILRLICDTENLSKRDVFSMFQCVFSSTAYRSSFSLLFKDLISITLSDPVCVQVIRIFFKIDGASTTPFVVAAEQYFATD